MRSWRAKKAKHDVAEN